MTTPKGRHESSPPLDRCQTNKHTDIYLSWLSFHSCIFFRYIRVLRRSWVVVFCRCECVRQSPKFPMNTTHFFSLLFNLDIRRRTRSWMAGNYNLILSESEIYTGKTYPYYPLRRNYFVVLSG